MAYIAVLLTAIAAEGGPYEDGVGLGDTLTITFNKPTNQIPLATDGRIHGLFNFTAFFGVLSG